MIDIPDFVYPKDAAGNPLCPRCQKLLAQCDCPSLQQAQPKKQAVKPSVRLDKSGRKGKVVTLISSLPSNEQYLKETSKALKVKTGSGGTFYINLEGGVIELQGDHKKIVMEFFFKNNDKE